MNVIQRGDVAQMLAWVNEALRKLDATEPTESVWFPPKREDETKAEYEARKEESTQTVMFAWDERPKLRRKRLPFTRVQKDANGKQVFDLVTGDPIEEPVYQSILDVEQLTLYEQARKVVGISGMASKWNSSGGLQAVARMIENIRGRKGVNRRTDRLFAPDKRRQRDMRNAAARKERELLHNLGQLHDVNVLLEGIYGA